MSETTQAGVKFDQDKLPWHLTPWDALQAIVKVLAFGAKKYAPRNWEKGMEYHRLHRAAIGHLIAWWECEGPDLETGYSHLWHAGCCVMFLIAYEIRGIGTDDRPKKHKLAPLFIVDPDKLDLNDLKEAKPGQIVRVKEVPGINVWHDNEPESVE